PSLRSPAGRERRSRVGCRSWHGGLVLRGRERGMRRTSFARVVPILWLCAPAAAAAAPQVDAADSSTPARAAEAAQEAPDRWALAVDFGFHGQVGNTQLVALSTGFQLRHLET